MENILPVSDLRSYNQTLKDVKKGQQVILTKNGHPQYVVSDFDEWQKMTATIELFSELQKGVQSFQNETPMTMEQLRNRPRPNRHE